MKRWMAGVLAAGTVLVVVAGCRSEVLSRNTLPARPAGPVAPVLLGLQLGSANPLPRCSQQPPVGPCLQPAAQTTGDTGLHPLQLAPAAPVPGLQRDAVVLRLDDRLESVSLQFHGQDALDALPLMLEQLCGPAEFDSRMDLDQGNYLRSISWQCPDALVQLNALQQQDQARGALSLTTARGQAWFDGGQPVPDQRVALR